MKRLHWPLSDPSATGDIAAFRTASDQIRARIEVLAQLLTLPDGPAGTEFHASIRVRDLTASTRFYGWLLNTWPGKWTHRYATFILAIHCVVWMAFPGASAGLHHDHAVTERILTDVDLFPRKVRDLWLVCSCHRTHYVCSRLGRVFTTMIHLEVVPG